MARRQRLCPEITDPDLRAFLDMAPSVRRYQRDIVLSGPLHGRKISIPLADREIPIILHASDGDTPRPVVFELHGGGFVFGLPEKDDGICEALREQLACHVISIEYRLSPEVRYPAALDDVCEVINYIREHAAEYLIDPTRMALLGFSGGATLAAACCLRCTPGIVAQVLHYPYLDSSRLPEQKRSYSCDMDPGVMAAFTRLYSAEEERALPEVSPVFASREQLAHLPPTLVIPAACDALREEGEDFAKKCQDAGVETLLTVFPGTHHSYIEDSYQQDVYNAMTSPEAKATHDPHFRMWAQAAMAVTGLFLREQFEKPALDSTR